MATDTPLLKLTGLWAKVSRNGRPYLVGRLSGCRVLIFENSDHDRREGDPTHFVMLGQADPPKPGTIARKRELAEQASGARPVTLDDPVDDLGR